VIRYKHSLKETAQDILEMALSTGRVAAELGLKNLRADGA